MNPYFSRLAQRSAITPQSSSARSGAAFSTAESGWSEQSVEIVAPSSATPSDHAVDKEHGKEVHVAATGKTDNTSATSRPSTAVSTLIDPAQKNLDIGNTSTPSVSKASSETKLIDNAFHEHDQTIEQTAAKVTASSGLAPISATASSTIKSVSVFSGHSSSVQVPEEPETSEQVLHAGAFSPAVTETTSRLPENRNQKSVMATSGFENVYDAESNQAQVIPGNPVPSMQTVKSERVMSGPVQAAMPIQQARPASRTSIEVNIGKIELEVFAPATKAAAPVAPAPASAPRPKPAAVFNPHRHYLRGR